MGVAEGEGEALEFVVGEVQHVEVLHLPDTLRHLAQQVVGQVQLEHKKMIKLLHFI